jgi:hypothetical protein
MGSGRSRLPPPDPIGDLHREIRGLNDRVNVLNNHINNLNNIDRVKQRAINNLKDNLRISNNSDILHTGERDNYNRLYTADETVTIPALVTERDTLIAIRDDLYTKLGKSESSNKMTNDAAQTLADNTTQLSSQTVALDLQNYDTKLKLYEGIRVQNRTLMEKTTKYKANLMRTTKKYFINPNL